MRIRIIWLAVGFVFLVGVLFVWLNEQERKPSAAATHLASPLPYITPSPVPTRDPALVPASFYTVDEVWAQAEALNGQRIAVRGLAGYYLVKEDLTQYCIHDCACPRAVEFEFLLRGTDHAIVLSLPQCECYQAKCCEDWSIWCHPFDPRLGEAYEMVGELRVFYEYETIMRMVLQMEYADAQVSSQLVGEGNLSERTRVPLDLETALFPIDEIPLSQIMPTPTPTPEPITLYNYLTADVASLDPQWAVDTVSQDYVENLFVQLTNYDGATGEIVPDAAATWQINATATVYTFTLHPNIPWVNHDPRVPGTTQVADESGQPRFVTAQDFVYGIRRLCDPANETPGAKLVAPLLQGCAAARAYPSLGEIPAELWQAIGVTAWDNQTLVIELAEPSAPFLAMTTLGILSATPQWAIDERGDDWVENGSIVTSGRLVLTEWIHNVRVTLLRNPLFPPDLAGTGNIAQVSTILLPDHTTGYALWLNGQMELATIPDAELEGHLAQHEAETEIIWISTGFPFDPHLADAVYVARHEWLTYTHNPYGAQQWYNWSVDGEKQAAARGKR